MYKQSITGQVALEQLHILTSLRHTQGCSGNAIKADFHMGRVMLKTSKQIKTAGRLSYCKFVHQANKTLRDDLLYPVCYSVLRLTRLAKGQSFSECGEHCRLCSPGCTTREADQVILHIVTAQSLAERLWPQLGALQSLMKSQWVMARHGQCSGWPQHLELCLQFDLS